MAESEKTNDGPPESPTTARELDFDDDEVAASPRPAKSGTATEANVHQSTSEALTPPLQPPRPMSPRQQAETTLREAFPSIEGPVIRAVLVASGGQVEPAFNALLGMSDPDAQQEDPAPPPPPPRPVAAPRAPVGRTQLEQDEIYARQLAEHYNYQDSNRAPALEAPRNARSRPSRNRGTDLDEADDRDNLFMDDDFAAIRDGIKKGFVETQSKVNSFITNLKKRIDGDEDDEEPPPQPPRRPLQQYGGRRSGDTSRRSGDRDRYDADPEVLGDDFTELQLRDDTTPPRRGGRPLANPDLFKPTPAMPQSNRRVSFQDGPPEEIGEQRRASPNPTNRPSSTSRGKWQPLATVDPSPVADHDPFSLGDSDEDDSKKKDPKPEDTERLKRATAEAMSEDLGPVEGHEELGRSERTGGVGGTKDKAGEETLAGKA